MFCFELTFQPAKTEGIRASALARVVREGIAARDGEAAKCGMKMLAMARDRVSPRPVRQIVFISSFEFNMPQQPRNSLSTVLP